MYKPVIEYHHFRITSKRVSHAADVPNSRQRRGGGNTSVALQEARLITGPVARVRAGGGRGPRDGLYRTSNKLCKAQQSHVKPRRIVITEAAAHAQRPYHWTLPSQIPKAGQQCRLLFLNLHADLHPVLQEQHMIFKMSIDVAGCVIFIDFKTKVERPPRPDASRASEPRSFQRRRADLGGSGGGANPRAGSAADRSIIPDNMMDAGVCFVAGPAINQRAVD
ncbi:hypothetical protein EVAR_39471_1 [Eumeta japonica]|uniref:Uncharacterized protein n=1 Tax=Eumeta variegata TaxID=151549 RepID=A0A4C1W075_EUMVA|nr:hypothetical protein EVAR_39471_1 [Eumeta japonica]